MILSLKFSLGNILLVHCDKEWHYTGLFSKVLISLTVYLCRLLVSKVYKILWCSNFFQNGVKPTSYYMAIFLTKKNLSANDMHSRYLYNRMRNEYKNFLPNLR